MANALIFHGTGGYPEENWFPWLKNELEQRGNTVFVPQFPTPENQTPETWFAVLDEYHDTINEETMIFAHSLGGAFLLRLLETLDTPIALAVVVGSPVGIQPIQNYEGDKPFIDPPFRWETIRSNAKRFVVFHSDNDPYVPLGNGELTAKNLGIELTLIPGAGHFNQKAGYTEFPEILEIL